MPRKRSAHTPRPAQHTPLAPLPVLEPILPPITQEWLAHTGQVLPQSTDGLDTLVGIVQPGAGRYSVNQTDSGVYYHKWSYGKGKWRGHYVMYVHDGNESLAAGLVGLEGKLDDVRRGKLKPSRDPYFKG